MKTDQPQYSKVGMSWLSLEILWAAKNKGLKVIVIDTEMSETKRRMAGVMQKLAAVVLTVCLSCAYAADVETLSAPEKCIIFRDADAAKVNEAVLNFLKTKPVITRVLQSESLSVGPFIYGGRGNYHPKETGNILTITIFYKEK